MDNYALIGRVKITEIPEAQTLNMAFYNGLPFAVSKDVSENDLYVIFLPDGQLSEEYATANDCVGYTDPDTGKRKGGFFAKNRKVRAVKFMNGKIRSVGYVASLDSLKFTGYDISKLEEGFEFSELNGIPICTKFVNQATRNARAGSQRKARKSRNLIGFTEHQDTKMYYKNKHKIAVGQHIIITEKLDGTSVRCANAYEKLEFKWWQKLLNKLIPLEKMNYVFVTGTRRVVLTDGQRESSYYDDDNIYKGQTEVLRGKLHPGESVYGEIVGWLNPQKALFDRGGVKFTYGTQPGERAFYVYAIKWTLPDGTEIHLPWDAVKQRCMELGVPTVPEEANIMVTEDDLNKSESSLSNDEDSTNFDELIYDHTVGRSTLDEHIREGCVIRIEDGFNVDFLKSKSEEYYALEDAFKNDEKNVDIEETA